MPPFTIRVAHPDLLFSASHFITFADGGVESLHGHDYRVTAEIRGRLGESGYLVDFTEVHDMVKALLGNLDHRVLLPEKHPTIRIEPSSEEYVVTYNRRRWIFPQTDCCLLPVVNTTAEALAEFLAQRIFQALKAKHSESIETMQVEVREGTGFSGICTFPNQ
jgi:6-pyruvoyltetrahydropterin/6-carboxytetrahydropterin synthase